MHRVTEEQLQKVGQMAVANIDDTLGRNRAIDSSIRPVNDRPLIGRAYTVSTDPGDNLFIYHAINQAQAGDILMVDAKGFTNRAVCGEIVGRMMLAKGLAGLVVDGAIRDLDALKELPLPVYAKGISPNGPLKNGKGKVQGIISIGGQVVHPGDLVRGDGDGVIILRPDEVDQAIRDTEEVEAEEAKKIANLKEGKLPDLSWVEETIKNLD